MGIKYYETSAKTGKNIENTFQELCGDLLEMTPDQITQPLQIHNSKIIGESQKRNTQTEENVRQTSQIPAQKLKP